METLSRPVLGWGVATLTLANQTESGDRHLVKSFPHGALVAVVDGLGHGEEAATAAKLALTTLERYAQEPLIALLRRCHERLRATRGVVMSLASFNALEGTMTWLGVGNVEAILLRVDSKSGSASKSLLLRGGTVGDQLPPLRTSVLSIVRGDTLIMATDGIRSGFAQGLTLSDPPQRIADRILAEHARGADDALVLVARYLGGAP